MLPHVLLAHPSIDQRRVDSLGNYTLLQINDSEYELRGPDNRCPTDWLIDRLPAGPWLTEWAGRGSNFILRIFRPVS